MTDKSAARVQVEKAARSAAREICPILRAGEIEDLVDVTVDAAWTVVDSLVEAHQQARKIAQRARRRQALAEKALAEAVVVINAARPVAICSRTLTAALAAYDKENPA